MSYCRVTFANNTPRDFFFPVITSTNVPHSLSRSSNGTSLAVHLTHTTVRAASGRRRHRQTWRAGRGRAIVTNDRARRSRTPRASIQCCAAVGTDKKTAVIIQTHRLARACKRRRRRRRRGDTRTRPARTYAAPNLSSRRLVGAAFSETAADAAPSHCPRQRPPAIIYSSLCVHPDARLPIDTPLFSCRRFHH